MNEDPRLKDKPEPLWKVILAVIVLTPILIFDKLTGRNSFK